MRRVRQLGLSDCFGACLATIFEKRIHEVINIYKIDMDGRDWFAALKKWCRSMGYKLIYRKGGPQKEVGTMRGIAKTLPYYIYDGYAFHGFYHARVGKGGKLVFDPAGDGGVMLKIRGYYFFQPLKRRVHHGRRNRMGTSIGSKL